MKKTARVIVLVAQKARCQKAGITKRCSTMAWEQRSSKMCYYRKKRKGNRVVSEYLGSGLAAKLHAEMDREEREKLLATQRKWRKQISKYKVLEADYEFLVAVINGLVRATYLTSGYHPYKGQWRKKRHAK